MSFRFLKRASFAHSAVYAGLLASWAAGWEPGQQVFGWSHGLGWFAMCALAVWGLRARVIPLYVAVSVAVIGAVGPFFGTASFMVEERRKQRDTVQASWR